MDPLITAPMLVSALTKLLDSAGTEAGKRAWGALARILARSRAKRLTRGEAHETESVASEPPTSPEAIAALADGIARMAAADPELAHALRTWHSSVTAISTGAGGVSNTVSGTTHGSVVQGRDISGPITFT
jgi:hypothetical protein